jgi:SAM-dependent methyltransferase
VIVSQYTLPHELSGEEQRLSLMSKLLDPIERSHIRRLGLRSGSRCLEIGCGNGSISQWLAPRVAPNGYLVATDIDTKLIDQLRAPCLEVRRVDILRDSIETAAYDLVSKLETRRVAGPKVAAHGTARNTTMAQRFLNVHTCEGLAITDEAIANSAPLCTGFIATATLLFPSPRPGGHNCLGKRTSGNNRSDR